MCGTTETPGGFKVDDLRKKLSSWTTGKVVNDILQVPGTSDCFKRATEDIPASWAVSKTVFHKAPPPDAFVQKTKTAVTGVNFNKQAKIVALQVTGHWGGADSKAFGKNGHWVLLIDTGADDTRKEFVVVFDPDVTATDRSRAAWAQFSNNVKKEQVASEDLITAMVVGKGGDLGALVRYYRPC